MSNYSKQLINELIEQLDNTLIKFYNEYLIFLDMPILSDVITEVLDENYYSLSNKEELANKNKEVQAYRRNTKLRWYKNLIASLDKYSSTDKKNPFYEIYHVAASLPPEQFSIIYNKCSVDDVVNEKLNILLDWKINSDLYLISFPYLTRVTPAKIYVAYKSDIITNIFSIIKDNYNGNLGGVFKAYPTELIDKPIFSPSSYNLILDQTSDGLINSYTLDDNIKLDSKLVIPNSDNNSIYKVMDALDAKLLNLFITNIDEDFYKTRKVTLTISLLSNNLYGNYTGNYADLTTNRAMKLSSYNYTFYDKNNKSGISFNLFDNIILNPNSSGVASVTVTFGEILYKAIIQKKLVKVLSRSYDSLENNLSQLLYYALQSERFTQSSLRNNIIPIMEEYSYSFFLQRVRFPSRNKKNNIKLIIDSLNEFVEKQIAIKSFFKNNDKFVLEFLALSEDEKADLENSEIISQ